MEFFALVINISLFCYIFGIVFGPLVFKLINEIRGVLYQKTRGVSKSEENGFRFDGVKGGTSVFGPPATATDTL